MGLRSQNNPIASFRDVFSATGTDAVRAAPPGNPQGITATGGVISDYAVGNNIYRAHIFTSSGTFDVSELSTDFPNDVDYLVVAGGGGGGLGSYTGAGGGGGGFRTSMPEGPGGPGTSAENKITVTAQPYSITVGGGGAGGYSNNNDTATQGTPSYIGPPGAKIVESIGGGKGSDGPGQSGGPGGSGGGGAGDLQNTNAGPAVTPTQGYPGGSCQNSAGPTYAAGGGGGAGGAGHPGVPGQRSATNGDGGAGKRTSITGPAYSVGTPGPGGSGGYLAGGGATGSENYVTYRSGPASPGPGGGGGGNNPGDASSGTASTGGGGGGDGTGQTGAGQAGGGGGSGIVIVRYQIGELTATAKATGGAISFYNGKTIHTFVASGDFTTNAGFNETIEYVIVGGGGAGGAAGPNSYGAGGGGAGQMLVGSGPVSTPSSTPHAVLIGSGGNYSSNTGIRGGIGVQSSVAFPGGTKYGNGGAGGGSNDLGGSQNGGNGSNYPSTSQGSGSGGGACKDNPTGGSGGPSALGAHPGGGIPIAPGQAGYGAAGGGGAGGAGFPGSTTPGPMAAPWTEGGGGIGLQAPTTFRNPKALAGTPGANPGGFYFAGGGAGGLYEANPDADRVGSGSAPGGGGLGGQCHGNCKGGDGLFATGAGGGGAGAINTNNTFYGGHGGSGIVLIAYPS